MSTTRLKVVFSVTSCCGDERSLYFSLVHSFADLSVWLVLSKQLFEVVFDVLFSSEFFNLNSLFDTTRLLKMTQFVPYIVVIKGIGKVFFMIIVLFCSGMWPIHEPRNHTMRRFPLKDCIGDLIPLVVVTILCYKRKSTIQSIN